MHIPFRTSQPWLVYRGRGKHLDDDKKLKMNEILDRCALATLKGSKQAQMEDQGVGQQIAHVKKVSDCSIAPSFSRSGNDCPN
jgi:hypothetical protein